MTKLSTKILGGGYEQYPLFQKGGQALTCSPIRLSVRGGLRCNNTLIGGVING